MVFANVGTAETGAIIGLFSGQLVLLLLAILITVFQCFASSGFLLSPAPINSDCYNSFVVVVVVVVGYFVVVGLIGRQKEM